MKKNWAILILIFMPGIFRQILFGMYLDGWGINKVWLEKNLNYINLLGNLSPFLAGVFMLINPDFFAKILGKLIKGDIENNLLLATLAIRAIGLVLIVLTIISSRYFLNEIQ